jgi:hypothetical protein
METAHLYKSQIVALRTCNKKLRVQASRWLVGFCGMEHLTDVCVLLGLGSLDRALVAI